MIGGSYNQEIYIEAKRIEEIKGERSIDKKIYTLIVKNLNIGLKNVIVGLNDYIL